MNRRHFLLASSAAVAGCGRTRVDPVRMTVADQHEQAARRAEHLVTLLKKFRVPATAARTTPPPPVAVPEVFPQLKPLVKMTARLHPRFGAEPAADATKVGGRFAWPADADRPAGLLTVLQLRADDAPPQFPFPPGSDLLQLFWRPPAQPGGAPEATIFWRKRAECSGPPLDPLERVPYPVDWLPVPCLVFPERVAEYPPPGLMPKLMREQIEKWTPPAGAGEPGPRYFADRLAAAPGIKVGGWPRRAGEAKEPTCATCKRLMDFLLTVDTREWDDRTKPRWQPAEEQNLAEVEGYRTAVDLRVGPDGRGAVHVFACRRCDGWPVQAVLA